MQWLADYYYRLHYLSETVPVVIEGSTWSWPTATELPVIEDSIQMLSGGGVIFDGLTLPPNAQTTISGTRVSVVSVISVVNGVTSTLPPYGASFSASGLGAVIASCSVSIPF